MAKDAPILDYLPPEPRLAGRLTLEEGGDFVRVLFPVMPTWVYMLSIGVYAASALMSAVEGFVIPAKIWGISRMGGQPTPAIKVSLWHFAFIMALWLWLTAFFWGLLAVLAWRKYRRWGRVPRVLHVNGEGLTLSCLGWRGMRYKHWPIGEIIAVKLRPVRGNLTWWKTAADLIVRRQKRFRLKFRLSSTDSQLPGHIATRIQSLLGHTPQPGLV